MQNILVCVFETNFTSQVSKGLRFPSESFTLTLQLCSFRAVCLAGELGEQGLLFLPDLWR